MLLKLWKLAARTFVLADGPGFVERALPGSEPGGVLSWLSDVYATLGLVDGLALPAAVLMAALASAAVWFLAFPGLKRALRAPLAAIPFVWWTLALLTVDRAIWFIPVPSFLARTPMGVVFACLLAAALRPLARRGWWGVLLTGVVGVAAYVPFGCFGPAGAALALAAAPWRSGGWPVGAAGLATATLLGFSCHIVCRAVYDDFAVSLVRTTDFQCWRSWEDASDILASERALVEGDFARCAAVARGDAKAHRIVLARRILSLYRLGRFPAALGELPPMCIADEAEDPLSSADGYLLYFNYGLFGPARYWMEENGAHFGDQPIYLRYLGDIVLLGGEAELAKRYYRRYARCPFRAAEARERLAYCESPETARQFLMKNAALAKMARTWAEEGPRRRIPTFFTPTEQAELFIYECFYVLDEKAPAEMRMMSQVAARLLGREPPR